MNETPAEPKAKASASKNSMPSIQIAIAVVLAVLLAITAYSFMTVSGLKNDLSAVEDRVSEVSASQSSLEQQEGFFVNDAVDKDGFQAVYLDKSNVVDNVFFGKLEDGEAGQLKLTNIYYLQEGGGAEQFSLAKRGSELSGPKDEMQINRERVLYWENLKADGQVSQAIRDFESN